MNDWRLEAACRDLPGELFFPIGTLGVNRSGTESDAAKAVCATCPVTATCLTWALDTNERHGVWGGLDEDERETLRRQARQDVRKVAES
jgi:WhiB family redox-sensing transcriptional regulator